MRVYKIIDNDLNESSDRSRNIIADTRMRRSVLVAQIVNTGGKSTVKRFKEFSE